MLNRTKAELKALGNPTIGIELRDGKKLFGKVNRFTTTYIFIKDKDGDIKDVPRRIIKRCLLLIDGGKVDGSEVFYR